MGPTFTTCILIAQTAQHTTVTTFLTEAAPWLGAIGAALAVVVASITIAKHFRGRVQDEIKLVLANHCPVQEEKVKASVKGELAEITDRLDDVTLVMMKGMQINGGVAKLNRNLRVMASQIDPSGKLSSAMEDIVRTTEDEELDIALDNLLVQAKERRRRRATSKEEAK